MERFSWTQEAINYSWRELARRAGIPKGNSHDNGFEALGLPVCYDHPDRVSLNRPGIIVLPCTIESWYGLLDREQNTLNWVSISDVMPTDEEMHNNESIPILFWGEGYEDGHKPIAEQREDGTIVFYVDIIATTFFMLSRWEEIVSPTRDQHDRFPGYASVAFRHGFLDRPLVDEYALILRSWIKKILPQWVPLPQQFTVKLSHDIDNLREFPLKWRTLLSIGGDLLKRHSIQLAWYHSSSMLLELLNPKRSRYFYNIQLLANLSISYGLESTFNFMTADPGPFDNRYNIFSPSIKKCINELRKQGLYIGFHPGYSTYNNPTLLAIEKARMDKVLGDIQYGGRQHYLRFKVPDTWRYLEQVGLSYDSSMGYADHEGFRCGTCHPFHPFDIQQDRVLCLLEWPLIVQDTTLQTYRKLTPQQAKIQILTLAQRCLRAGGVFTFLWHNSSLNGPWLKWGDMYKEVLASLRAIQAESSSIMSDYSE